MLFAGSPQGRSHNKGRDQQVFKQLAKKAASEAVTLSYPQVSRMCGVSAGLGFKVQGLRFRV